MNLSEAVEIFKSKDLFVQENPFHFPGGIRIAGKVDRHGEIWVLNDVVYIYPDSFGWVFHVAEGTPVPMPDDVTYEVSSLEEVVNITLKRYFGKPLIIEGWSFPVHKHPEWDVELLKQTLMVAEQVTPREWADIKKRYNDQLRDIVNQDLARWFDHPELVFRSINNIEDTNKVLWISRDLRKAYVVA